MAEIQFLKSAVSPGDAISKAWELVTANLGLYIGVGIVAGLMIGCIPLVNLVLMGPVMGGVAYMVLRDIDNENVEFGMLFKGFEKFLPLMVVGLIHNAPGIIFQVLQWVIDIGRLVNINSGGRGNGGFGQLGRSSAAFMQTDNPFGAMSGALIAMLIIIGFLIWVFMILWSLAFQFTYPLIMEHDLSIGEAISTSARAVMGNLGSMIVLIILEGLVALLGVIAFCLGLLVAIPVIWAANIVVYTQVFPRLRPEVNYAPPSPQQYGFGGGY